MNIDQMLDILERLKRLPHDWDGENSPPITEEAILTCKKVIQDFADYVVTHNNGLIKIGTISSGIKFPAFLYPLKGGGLSFRWETDKFSKLLIMPDGAIVHRVE